MHDVLLATLPARATLLRSLRATLDDAGFVEVETPVRIPAPANEPHIIPPPSGGAFLRASPELQMKQLVALGLHRIYQIGPCFRAGERGDRHNPEFTMLEWYRGHSDALAILGDLKKLVCAAAAAVCGSHTITWQGAAIDLAGAWEKIPVRDAFRRFAGWDPVDAFDAGRFDLDMALKVEPSLPRDRPCVLVDYPAQAASLARLRADDPRVAERWEAYIGGLEICNACGELVDAAEQRARFEAARAEKQALGETAFALDEAFLASLARMPPSGGAALGVDRLAMLLLDAPAIDHVRPFCPPIGDLW
ncbi:MAG: amino acid--tRNA ligase-related protein [Kiritimatiellia bacterium]|jgi:lysyl-tRNA synthetase class 2